MGKFLSTNSREIGAGKGQIDALNPGTQGLIQFVLEDYNGKLDLLDVLRVAKHDGLSYFERLPSSTDGLLEAVMFYNQDIAIVKLYRKQIYVFVKGGLFAADDPLARTREDRLHKSAAGEKKRLDEEKLRRMEEKNKKN